MAGEPPWRRHLGGRLGLELRQIEDHQGPQGEKQQEVMSLLGEEQEKHGSQGRDEGRNTEGGAGRRRDWAQLRALRNGMLVCQGWHNKVTPKLQSLGLTLRHGWGSVCLWMAIPGEGLRSSSQQAALSAAGRLGK